MMRPIYRPLLLVAFLATAGLSCASSGAAPATTSGPRDLITAAQLAERSDPNLYEAIRQLRPSWLRMRGVESATLTQGVIVYLDNVRIGEVSALRDISPNAVQWVRFYDGLTATSRWGTDHGNGVILVSTRP